MVDITTTTEPTTTTVPVTSIDHSRHREWFTLAGCSTIALVGLTSALVQDLKDTNKHVKWAASVMSISLGLSGLAVFAHVAKDKFVGTSVETGLAVIIFAFWAAGLPSIMDPNNQIATNNGGAISNANLYFFSWGAFIMSLIVMIRSLRARAGWEKSDAVDQFHVSTWAGLMATSLVVMASASKLYKKFQCDHSSDDFCKRTKFAVSLGVVSGIVALIWMILGRKLPRMATSLLGLCMLAAWVFGVAYITFGGRKAPAFNSLGNLYFFSWASFVLACFMGGDGWTHLTSSVMGGKKKEMTETEEAKADMDKVVEELDHKNYERNDEEKGANVIVTEAT